MMQPEFKDLEDYGIIGNLETCALVGNDGSVGWLCLPYLDSASVFAPLLDPDHGGRFRVGPAAKYTSVQSYLPNTNILRTTFTTATGVAALEDFMPVKGRDSSDSTGELYRRVECLSGSVELQVEFAPRLDYGRQAPVFESDHHGVRARTSNEELFLQCPARPAVREHMAKASIELRAGQLAWLVLKYGGGGGRVSPDQCQRRHREVAEYWRRWAHTCERSRCLLDGDPWHDLLVRSGLVLKLLANPETGAIAAAATTSLPEEIGGVRNWDYRFAWLRDASFTDQALFHLGHVRESNAFRRWVNELACRAGDPNEIRTMYGLRSDTVPDERVLDHLSGYCGSAPVRVGNGAVNQRQLDIYGEVLNAIYDTTRHGENIASDEWPNFWRIADYVCRVWNSEDNGIWEVRGGPQHFVYSKLMCWVALDRAVKMARQEHLEAPSSHWAAVRDTIKEAILKHGFNRRLGSFVQSFDSDVLDATALLIPSMELLPADDFRVQGTIRAIQENLMANDTLVYRYRHEDGLPGAEGCFVLCTFWLVKALALSGRIDEAEELLIRVLRYASPLGLLAEEVDPHTGKLLGNFPQAFSHIGLVNSALYLGVAKGREHTGPAPIGTRPGNRT